MWHDKEVRCLNRLRSPGEQLLLIDAIESKGVVRAMAGMQRRHGHASGSKGVYWRESRKKWEAGYKWKGEYIRIGEYGSEEAAACAYDEAVRAKREWLLRRNLVRNQVVMQSRWWEVNFPEDELEREAHATLRVLRGEKLIVRGRTAEERLDYLRKLVELNKPPLPPPSPADFLKAALIIRGKGNGKGKGKKGKPSVSPNCARAAAAVVRFRQTGELPKAAVSSELLTEIQFLEEVSADTNLVQSTSLALDAGGRMQQMHARHVGPGGARLALTMKCDAPAPYSGHANWCEQEVIPLFVTSCAAVFDQTSSQAGGGRAATGARQPAGCK